MKSIPITLLLLLVAAMACTPRSRAASGQEIATIGDLSPDAKIPTSAKLKIGEIEIPVEIVQTTKGEEMTIEISAHGQVFENETYQIGDKSFDLLDVAGEHYEPKLPLLRFPMRIGETWDWTGRMTAGEEPHKATATITSTSDSVLLPGSGSTDTVLVIVDLSIESGGPTPANRKLRFWFAKDKGLVKRQFGIGSSREPAE